MNWINKPNDSYVQYERCAVHVCFTVSGCSTKAESCVVKFCAEKFCFKNFST
ncbi:Protein of unknown function [Bacillus mobilis]|nr:Protein of unknown function [Bacillus mobilis]